ncbi:MAG TPA: TIGR01459 family HAD-type hydrolase [Sphingomicrobium sp.]|nr:TIGR01459 family HAD-type hydrolase [Sphingomicrobium sp.]
MSPLDGLPDRYRLILCDIWGVVHDGVELYPGSAERLLQWKDEGRIVILITNAPRTAEAVEAQLVRIGLPRATYDGIATSGEAGIAALLDLAEPVGFIGTEADRSNLQGRGVPMVEDGFKHLACTGLDDTRRAVADYSRQLESLERGGVVLHCLNPDRIVLRGTVPEPCAGALADMYESLGGTVIWYGKPHETIYRHALKLGGDPPPSAVLAIGDSLQTDILGAARMGFDAIFITGGIHGGEPFPPDFGAENGLGAWLPVAVVDSLG